MKAVKEKKLVKQKKMALLLEEAVKNNIISQAEFAILKKAEASRLDAITVDDFSQEEYLGKSILAATRKTA